MEADMNDYSSIIVLLLLLPAVAQIVIPLLLLVGYGLRNALRALFAKQTEVNPERSGCTSPQGVTAN